MGNSIKESAIKKLKLLFTVVERPKAEFYLDVLSQFEINCQMLCSGKGTAHSELVDLLGLNIHKAVLLSVVREDMVETVMDCLEEKFSTIMSVLFPPSATARPPRSPRVALLLATAASARHSASSSASLLRVP